MRPTGQVRERTGLTLGKRQLEQLALRAAVDFESFDANSARSPDQQHNDTDDGEHDVLVLSVDGKGIVMRPDALRPATAKAAQAASPKLKTRLSRGEKPNRKRIAEVGAVYNLTPTPRTPADVLASTSEKKLPAPKAKHKWLTASVIEDAAQVVGEVFDEAQRRDPNHERTWVALVDGSCRRRHEPSNAHLAGMPTWPWNSSQCAVEARKEVGIRSVGRDRRGRRARSPVVGNGPGVRSGAWPGQVHAA